MTVMNYEVVLLRRERERERERLKKKVLEKREAEFSFFGA